MNAEFTRKQLYDLVWSQPMTTVAASVGISDVALAKHCKKANIPVPSRGYWARKEAGKPTIQIALPPRFPGTVDRIGGSADKNHYWGSNWAEKFMDVPVPPVPVFEEEMSSVSQRALELVGKVRCGRKFEPAHPLVAKLLAHDEERRKEFNKWRSEYYKPLYDAGIERRRLLIINTLFLVSVRLGCRPSMSTSKYNQDPRSERDLSVTVGKSHTNFAVEPTVSKKESQGQHLRLSFGLARDRAKASKFWEDRDGSLLEDQLTDVLAEILVNAEASYRTGIVRHREWIIERKAAAEVEIRRQKDEAERQARELQEKLATERIGRLLSQAKSLNRAEQIRSYVESVRSRVTEMPIARVDFEQWASWAQREADRIDPVKNGLIVQAIGEHSINSQQGSTDGD
ncbi:hypothetical protein [Streptomyces sp. AcH 505]|uniref:hypothetical protein n=1 Tax=Streptomyces sp. AcH 505 TaxID=352211 RepID=UPI0012FEFC01